MSPVDDGRPARSALHDVVIDRIVAEGYVAGSRRGEETAAIEALLARVPPQDREAFETRLRAKAFTFTATSDREVSRLLGIIGSIRHADAIAAERTKALAEAREAPDAEPEYVRVVVALVGGFEHADIRGMVIRRPDDDGLPLLLLRQEGVSPEDLALGLRAAALAHEKYGPAVTQELTIPLRNERRTRADLSSIRTGLDLLHASPRRFIRGVGEVPAMDMMTPRTVERR